MSARAACASAGLALLLAARVAGAHGDGNPNLSLALDPLPAELSGVRVEVHQTIAPQIVLENRSRRTIEVLDPHGLPFLRIGPRGVEGNLASRAWYATYAPGVFPASASEPPPATDERWQRVSREPSFGWFDPRLDARDVRVPHAVVDAGRIADVAHWQIPLLVDGKPATIRGTFRYRPPPGGAFTSRLSSPHEIAPGVRVTLLPGRPPGLLVTSSSPRPLVVFDREDRPFLRIGPGGVEANVGSSAWRASARAGNSLGDAPEAAGDGPRWRRVSTAPRFSWIEPRAGSSDDERQTDPVAASPGAARRARPSALAAHDAIRSWRVPMQLGDDRLLVTGTVAWQPIATASAR